MIMLTRLPLPLDLNSFEVCDISYFVSYKIVIFFLPFFSFPTLVNFSMYTICKYYNLIIILSVPDRLD